MPSNLDFTPRHIPPDLPNPARLNHFRRGAFDIAPGATFHNHKRRHLHGDFARAVRLLKRKLPFVHLTLIVEPAWVGARGDGVEGAGAVAVPGWKHEQAEAGAGHLGFGGLGDIDGQIG